MWKYLLCVLVVGETALPLWGQNDDFAGDGPLLGYTTNNPDSLPDVQRVDGRYRANLVSNADNITLHFNESQGRLDAKLVRFPFVYIARNIGIGTQADSQTAPTPTGNPYIFSGIQVHDTNLDLRNSSHVVVGHRGSTHFTIEGKNTLNGSSSVNDDGHLALPLGRADIRIEGTSEGELIVSWQIPNLSLDPDADAFHLYRGTGSLPGTAPSYGGEVYIGLITYAFELGGVPFVGTCDGVEFTALEETPPASSLVAAFAASSEAATGRISVAPVLREKVYELQSTTDFAQWTTRETFVATQSTERHTFSYEAPPAYYRVLERD